MTPTGLRARADESGGPRFVVPLLDLTARSDLQLERTRIRRIIAIVMWLLLVAAGVVGAFQLAGHPFLQIISFAAILAGLLNAILSAGGLARVYAERSARAAERRALARHPEPSRWDDR